MLEEWAEGVFSENDLYVLRGLLGESRQVDFYLSQVGAMTKNIRHRRLHDQSGRISISQRRKIISNLRKRSQSMRDELNPIAFNFWESYEQGQLRQLDYHTQSAIQNTIIKGCDEDNPAKDHFFVDLDRNLEELILRCEAALNSPSLQSRRGASSFEQTLQKDFDSRLVVDYRLNFKCFPSTYEDGAFMRSVAHFYRIAGFSSSNHYQRLIEIIADQKRAFGEERLKNWRPPSDLHPNKYPE